MFFGKKLHTACLLCITTLPAHAGWLDGALQGVIQETARQAVQGVMGGEQEQAPPAQNAPGTSSAPPGPVSQTPINAQQLRSAAPLPVNGDSTKEGSYDMFTDQPHLVVGGFRVAFVVQAESSAYTRGAYLGGGQETSGVSVSATLQLQGVTPQQLQTLTDLAYQDFLKRLASTGRKVIPHEQIAADPNFRKVNFANKTQGFYSTESNGRKYLVFTPNGIPLFFHQGEPLGDQGAFGWGNRGKVGEFGYQRHAVVLNPMLVIDFARTQSSGTSNGWLRNDANASATPLLALAGNTGGASTSLTGVARTTPISTTAIAHNIYLKKPITLDGQFGRVVTLDHSNNRALVGSMALLGLHAGPVRDTRMQALEADAGQYQLMAMRLLKTANAAFTQRIKRSPIPAEGKTRPVPAPTVIEEGSNDPLDF